MGAIVAGISGGLQIGGGALRSRAAEEQAAAFESAALYNARLAEQRGSREGARIRRIGGKALATQRTALAKSGVRLEGTPLAVLAANAAEIERQALETELEGRREASLERARAESVKTIGKRQSAAAMLSGAGRAAGFGIPLFLGNR